MAHSTHLEELTHFEQFGVTEEQDWHWPPVLLKLVTGQVELTDSRTAFTHLLAMRSKPGSQVAQAFWRLHMEQF